MPQKASMNNNARKYNRYNEVDERILALFAENKEKAFRLLYDTYYLPLCLYSVQFTGSAETSEDIVQNLFVLKSATYRVSWEFTCKTTKILLLYIFLGHNRNVVNTKFPYPIKRLEVIRRFNQKSMAFNQSLS